MEVKVKKLHENAIIPQYAKDGDAGIDLTATSKYYDESGNLCYGVGLAFEIPEGYVGLVFPRSSICKNAQSITNHVAVIDSGYRGEVVIKFKPTMMYPSHKKNYEYINYEIGDRLAQIIIMPYPQIKFVESKELSETARGLEGFGSTGK